MIKEALAAEFSALPMPIKAKTPVRFILLKNGEIFPHLQIPRNLIKDSLVKKVQEQGFKIRDNITNDAGRAAAGSGPSVQPAGRPPISCRSAGDAECVIWIQHHRAVPGSARTTG